MFCREASLVCSDLGGVAFGGMGVGAGGGVTDGVRGVGTTAEASDSIASIEGGSGGFVNATGGDGMLGAEGCCC